MRPPLRQAAAPLVVFIVALAVYATTAARTVTLVDSGELILTSATLGTAHPPGFPVYTLLGAAWARLWSLWPLWPLGGGSGVAFRMTLMSAACAALAAAAVTWAAREVMAWRGSAGEARRDGGRRRRKRPQPGEEGDLPAWQVEWLAVATGLTFAFSLTPWRYATVVEVYSLHLALLATGLALLLRWRRRLDVGSGRDLILAGAVFGLALGVHHVTAALAAPAAAVFVAGAVGWRAVPRRRDVRAAVVAALAMLVAYLYLPWAASRDPLLAWGDPDSAARLWDHVTGKQYQVYLFAGFDAMAENLGAFGRLVAAQATPLGLVVALAGLLHLVRRARPLFALVAWVAVPGTLYALQYDIAEDSDAYFLTTFLVLALALAAGLQRTARYWVGSRRAWPATVLASALPILLLFAHWPENDRSDYQIARHYVGDVLAGVGPGGLVLTRDWQLYAPFLYYHHLEDLRPDVTMVDVNLVRRSWYVTGYLERAYPGLMAAVARERDAYLALLGRWERGEPYDGRELTRRFVGLLDAMIAHHLAPPDGEAHLTLPLEPGVGQPWRWTPAGLTFAQSPTSSPPPPPRPVEVHVAPLLAEPLDEVAATKVRPTYGLMLANTGRHRLDLGRTDEAAELLAEARRLAPAEPAVWRFTGDLALATGDRPAALAAYRRALALAPADPTLRRQVEALGG